MKIKMKNEINERYFMKRKTMRIFYRNKKTDMLILKIS